MVRRTASVTATNGACRRELCALVASGAVDGLSIGFRTVKGRVDPASRVRRIVELDLWEISIVTLPLLNGARVRVA